MVKVLTFLFVTAMLTVLVMGIVKAFIDVATFGTAEYLLLGLTLGLFSTVTQAIGNRPSNHG